MTKKYIYISNTCNIATDKFSLEKVLIFFLFHHENMWDNIMQKWSTDIGYK